METTRCPGVFGTPNRSASVTVLTPPTTTTHQMTVSMGLCTRNMRDRRASLSAFT
ncbi:hypothetical protein D3C83_242570 [compost metagenome]